MYRDLAVEGVRVVNYITAVGMAVPIPKTVVVNPLKERMNSIVFKNSNVGSMPASSRDIIAAVILLWLWRNQEGLGKHLNCKGIAKVLLTAPAKDGIKNIVHGINNEIMDNDEILGAASCTTNAIVPTLKVLNDEFKILSGHIESVHSYTNDQNLIDNFHKKERRGRSAALNMVITETGAGKAVGQVLPELMGKLTANAVRVPTPNVSLAIINLRFESDVSVEELNNFLRQKAFHSELKEQIGFTNSPEVVSTDFVGDRHAGIIDSAATIANGNKCVLYVWYDNEYGYTAQLVGLAKEMVGLTYKRYPNFSESS